MKRNNYKGNNVGDYPVTVAEKVIVPSMRMRLHAVIKEIYESLAAIPTAISAAIAAATTPLEVEDITALTDEQLDALKCGDKVIKITGAQKHLYLVTYKGEGVGEGIVITCNFCGYSEAVAYDRTSEGWVLNGVDVKTYGDTLEVDDITALTDAQLDALKVGDAVAKVTGNEKHTYFVTYKATEGGGLCLSYFDATTVETESYDRTESGWVYNSKDKGAIPPAE